MIGLTATPPVSLPDAEAELYDALLGPVDFTVPTPAVVRDGHLAPYQELAWLTEPLTRRARLAGRARHALPRADHGAARPRRSRSGSSRGMRDRRRSADDDAELSWAEFQKRSPKLARAGIRFLLSGGLQPPTGAPRGEAYRQPPDLEDWLVLLEDYALRCLAPQGSREASDALRRDRRRAARARLPAHPQGRAPRHVGGRPAADRLAGQVARARRGALRRGRCARRRAPRRSCCATPSSPPSARTTRSPACSTRPPAPPATRCWRSPPTTAPRQMRPLLVSGRGLRCAPADAEVLLDALRAAAEERFALPEWEGEPDGLLVSLRSSGAEWMPRAWVELATRLLSRGHDARAGRHPRAARRGLELPAAERARRHDGRHHRRVRPADARALAATRSRRPGEGRLQLGRRVRRAGPRRAAAPTTSASCASTCTCSRPPRTARSRPARRTCTRSSARSRRRRSSASTRSTRELIARATDRAAARERWQIGTPYRGVELPTLLVRPHARNNPSKRGQCPFHGPLQPLAARAARQRARRRGRVRRARRRHGHGRAARRARARAGRARVGRGPPARGEEADAARAAARRRRARRRRRLPRARRDVRPRPPPRCGSSRARPATCAAS